MKYRGFTLIELMITIAVVGILAGVAYPSYVSFLVRGNRSQGQNFLLDLAQRQERLRLDRGNYSGNPVDFPLTAAVIPYYNAPELAVAAAGSPAFVASLTPIDGGPQGADGRLFINSAGEGWRDAVSSCALASCSASAPTALPWR